MCLYLLARTSLPAGALLIITRFSGFHYGHAGAPAASHRSETGEPLLFLRHILRQYPPEPFRNCDLQSADHLVLKSKVPGGILEPCETVSVSVD